MKFNIARQSLIPAFLTLVALATALMYRAEPNLATTIPTNTFPLPGELLSQLQAAYPQTARILTGILIVLSGLCIGRISTRFGLYAVNCCLAIPLYGIIACSVPAGENSLSTFVASLTLALVIQHFSRACRNGYSFDAVFRASFYLGILPLVYIPALPLLLLLPLALLVFGRTVREATVALTGLLLPGAILCYIAWGCGYGFTEPLLQIGSTFIEGQWLQFFLTTPLPRLILLGAISILSFAAIILYLTHVYATGNKPRLILTYNIGVLFFSMILILSPSASLGIVPLIAIPAALILPVFFIRINHILATTIYFLLLGTTFVYILLL